MSSSISPPSRGSPAVPSAKPKRVYPHLADLVARTEGLQPNNRASIQAWVEVAKIHWKQAKWHREAGILDSAYVDFLLAFTIVADIIPRCSGFPTFKTSGRSQSYLEFEQLSKELKKKQDDFIKVKKEIHENNKISGVQSAAQLEAERIRVQSPPADRISSASPENASKRKPEVRAKPEYLSARLIAKDR
ncbi:ubiquitin-specific protease doa4 [Maublancomyces gigas]|uniref:Ubiquitin-specific protease doa4 n=1 Tax=Discina gigas TaxID=1032678 RepID=A0ABR3GS50_9PEZI